MKANSWLYHYYMVQSRLQYSLAYGGQSPTSLAAFYPGMQNPTSGFPPGQNPFDGHMLHASFMTSPQGGVASGYAAGYAGYTPPPGAYNLHQHYQQHQHLDQRSSDSPLDFSAAASQYGNSIPGNGNVWNDEMRSYEDTKVIGFTDIGGSNGMDRTSSPDYR